MADGVIPLSRLKADDRGTVLALEGGGEFQGRVVDMGLHVGTEVEVISGGGDGGRVLVAVGDSRLGLGHGMAEKVIVAVDPD